MMSPKIILGHPSHSDRAVSRHPPSLYSSDKKPLIIDSMPQIKYPMFTSTYSTFTLNYFFRSARVFAEALVPLVQQMPHPILAGMKPQEHWDLRSFQQIERPSWPCLHVCWFEGRLLRTGQLPLPSALLPLPARVRYTPLRAGRETRQWPRLWGPLL